jgi:hypothetical protein
MIIRILDYDLITASIYPSADHPLVEKVKAMMAQGWEPLGAPCVMPESETSYGTMTQAMVKYERLINLEVKNEGVVNKVGLLTEREKRVFRDIK